MCAAQETTKRKMEIYGKKKHHGLEQLKEHVTHKLG